jgi:hypothetical protein
MNSFVKNNSLLISKPQQSSGFPILWLDAEDSNITTISGLVSQWNDKSGNDYHATQSIAADRPAYSTTISPRRVRFFNTDRLFTTLPTTNGVMILGTNDGTVAYGVSIPSGAYTIGRHDGFYMPNFTNPVPSIYSQVIVPSTATTDDINYWINYIKNKGAGNNYENTTEFDSFWRNWIELTIFPLIDTSNAISLINTWNGCSQLSSFPLIDTSQVTNFSASWTNCSSLLSFPLINTSSATILQATWRSCSSLSSFPLLNTSNVTNFQQTWQSCSGLTSFPVINTTNAISLNSTWAGCRGLTSFPIINTPNATNFSFAWQNCIGLTSFPSLPSLSSATTFQGAWSGCLNLVNFPANFFNGCNAVNFTNAFSNTNLSQTSIDNILVSINSNNTNNGTFNQSQGSPPSSVGQAAITAMRSRGWTITVTGGF